MKIKTFSRLVEKKALCPMVLRDATVVVDGHNYFFNSYEDSGLTHALGCDSHRYAAYLREHLAMFHKANVKCYFLLKGGHENMKDMNYQIKPKHIAIRPILMKDIYKEVLEEMGFEHVICEYESKKDIIALAQQLNCPVISYSIDYCFTGLQYIPKNQLWFNEHDNSISCRYFSLEKFMTMFRLTKKKIAIFLVLTEEYTFPENLFLNLFRHLQTPPNYFKRNLHIINWLTKNNKEQILRTIFNYISAEDKVNFLQELVKVELKIGRQEAGGLGAARLLRRDAAGDWFATGVVNNHVAIDYVNLYHSQVFFGSHATYPPLGQDDAMLLALDIVKYAYDLLTNFKNNGFTFVYDTKSERMTMHVETSSIRKPDYEANICVFENGWSGVRELGLFEHFLTESLGNTGQRGVAGDAVLRGLARLPADARLLAAALLYFSRARRADSTADTYAVLLSYVTLSIVYDNFDKNNLPEPPFAAKPILNPTTDKDDVTKADCNIAAAILADYATTSTSEVEQILDPELLHPLVQFQHCLRELNDLNALCGAPLRPAALRRALAGPLAYKLRRAMLGGDARQFVQELLSPAPTVLAFFNGLIEVYEEILSSISE